MYSFDSRVRYSEVDENRELTLTGIINYMQDCSTFQSEGLGLGIDYLERERRAWLLSAWQIVIERYPKLGEEITVSTWPYDFKGIYGYRNFTIRDSAGECLVKANSTWFFFDTEAGRPVRPEPAHIEAYRVGEEDRLDMEYAPRKVSLPEDYEEKPAVCVARHHIDTNHHVNNAQYVEIAREFLPERMRIRELRAEYKKAALLGDVIIPRVSCADGVYTVALCDGEGAPYALVWLRTGGA